MEEDGMRYSKEVTVFQGAQVAAAVTERKTLIREYGKGVLVARTDGTSKNGVAALVSADGAFEVVQVTWDGYEAKSIDRVLMKNDGDGLVVLDSAGNAVASLISGGSTVGLTSGIHTATTGGAYGVFDGETRMFGAGMLDETGVSQLLDAAPVHGTGGSYTLEHSPTTPPRIYVRYTDSDGNAAEKDLAADEDYTLSGVSVALSGSWSAPSYTYTDDSGVEQTAWYDCELYADYHYADDRVSVDIGGSVSLSSSAPNEPMFSTMDGQSGMEWTFTNQGNIRVRITSDGGSSWTPWAYFSKEGHRHSTGSITGWRYGLWKAKTVSKGYKIAANSNTTVTITEKPDRGYSYAAVMRIFTQHQTAVKVSGWNVNAESVSVDLSNHGNSGAISSSTLTVQLLELKN